MKSCFGRLSMRIIAAAIFAMRRKSSPDEGGIPLAYSNVTPPAIPEALQSLDRCGPMRPI